MADAHIVHVRPVREDVANDSYKGSRSEDVAGEADGLGLTVIKEDGGGECAQGWDREVPLPVPRRRFDNSEGDRSGGIATEHCLSSVNIAWVHRWADSGLSCREDRYNHVGVWKRTRTYTTGVGECKYPVDCSCRLFLVVKAPTLAQTHQEYTVPSEGTLWRHTVTLSC